MEDKNNFLDNRFEEPKETQNELNDTADTFHKHSWENSYMLNGIHTLNATVFILILIVIGGLALFLPKPTVSEFEKRDLAEMPKASSENVFTGEFAKKTALFYADTFPARESLVSFAGKLEEMRGIRPDDVRIHESTPPPSPQQPVSNPSSPTQTPSPPNTPQQDQSAPSAGVEPDDPNAVGEQIGSTFMYKNMALPIFWANPTASERYTQVLNSYANNLGDNVKIYNLVAPTAISFYLPEKYKKVSSDEKENIDLIYGKLSPKITAVDSYSEIEKIKNQYIYFRSDHHWTVRGAYAAYQAFCKSAGFEPVPLEKMEKHQIDNFVGSLYGQTQDSKLLETPDFVEYFVPPQKVTTTRYVRNQPKTPVNSSMFADFASGQNAYSVFLYGDFPLTHMVTGLNTGRKIAVIKESFGNAFSPFLVSHYDEVFVLDQRYFQLSVLDFIKEKGITDLLFVNNIFAANTDIRINELEKIMNQSYVPYVPKPVAPKPETTPTDEDSNLDPNALPTDEPKDSGENSDTEASNPAGEESAPPEEPQPTPDPDEELPQEEQEEKPRVIRKKRVPQEEQDAPTPPQEETATEPDPES